jgi:hypothetical protein
MKRYISLMLMLAFVMAVAVGCGGSPEDKIAKAQAAAEDGNFQEAIDILNNLLADENLTDDVRAQAEGLVAEYTAELGANVGDAAGGLLD